MVTSDPLVQVSAAARERPILFSSEMVRAILAGAKTQTRRMLRPQPPSEAETRAAHTSYGLAPMVKRGIGMYSLNDYERLPKEPGEFDVDGAVGFVRDRCGRTSWRCPYGVPGDRLWVRETWYCDDYRAHGEALRDPALRSDFLEEMHYRADHDCRDWEAGCPCRDENGRGAWRPSIHMPRWASRISLRITSVRVERLHEITDADAIAEGCPGIRGGRHPAGDDGMEPREEFEALWSRINGTASWNANPWVWVVGFELGEVRDGD